MRRRLHDELGIDRVLDLRVVLPSFRYRAVMDNGIVENEICPVFTALVPAQTVCRVDANEVGDHRWLPFRSFWGWQQDPSVSVSPWAVLQLEQLGPDFAYPAEDALAN